MAAGQGRAGHLLVRIAFVGLMVPTLWGAQCNPPDPPCSQGECPSGTVSECVGECVGTIGEGEPCDPNPCGGALCAYGLACTPQFTSDAVCRPAQNLDAFFCTEFVPCSTGNYCRRYTAAGGDFPRPANAPGAPYIGQCVAAAVEGAACIGDWATHATGAVCEAGIECRDDPRTPGARACFRPCADAGDCGCPAFGDALDQCIAVASPPPEGGICGQCNDNGEACGVGEWGCCDPLASCNDAACCRADAVACSSSGECCAGSVCGTGGECVGCPGLGDDPNPKVGGDGCCGLEARSVGARTVCAQPCTAGPCFPAACPANRGETSCAGLRPVCVEVVEGPEVACDEEDNDCDRAVDEFDVPGCRGPVPPSEDLNPETDLPRFLGCPGIVLEGQWTCRGREAVCEVTEGFCAVDSLGNQIDAAAAGEDCFTTGTACPLGGTGVCSPAEACCAAGPGSQCTALPDRLANDLCWRPGETTAEPGCPGIEPADCVGLTCAGCLDASRCGWCGPGGGNTCVDGDASGPFGGECDLSHWFTDPDDAPLVCL